MADREWPPEENCYCGGPEEIYPHRHGTGRYCRRKAAESPSPAPSPATAATEAHGETTEAQEGRE